MIKVRRRMWNEGFKTLFQIITVVIYEMQYLISKSGNNESNHIKTLYVFHVDFFIF